MSYLPDNLYAAPNGAMNNANILSSQIAQCQSNAGSGYNYGYNYNYGNSFLPLVGYGGATNINYTANANGVTYSYNNGPSALDYIGAIGGGVASIFDAISVGRVAKAMAQTQLQGQKYQYQAYQEQAERLAPLVKAQQERQQQQQSFSDMMNMMMMKKMMEKFEEMDFS